MSLRNITDEVAEFAYPKTNSLALVIAGLAWIGYLFTQSGAVMLGINSVHGCLLRLGAAMLFAFGTILICVAFRHAAPRAAVFQATFNLIAVIFYVRGVTHLLEIQPNVHGFVINYHVAQVLMSLAIFYMARCLQLDSRFPRWIGWMFYLYAATSTAQTMLLIAGMPLRPFDPPAMAIALAIELTYAFLMIKVGSRQLKDQEDLLHI